MNKNINIEVLIGAAVWYEVCEYVRRQTSLTFLRNCRTAVRAAIIPACPFPHMHEVCLSEAINTINNDEAQEC